MSRLVAPAAPRRLAPSRCLSLARTVLLAGLSLLLLACRGQAPSAGSYQFTVHAAPLAVGPAEVVVELKDAAGRPVENAAVQVEGNMSHAGMVPVNATAESVGGGRYVTRDFRFTMGGDWFLTATATLPAGERVSHRIDVKGVSAGMQQGSPGGHGSSPADGLAHDAAPGH